MSQNLNTTRPPQIDKVLREPCLTELSEKIRRDIIKEAVRQQIEFIKLSPSELSPEDFSATGVAAAARKRLLALMDGGIKKVINATGVILSTNLGRAPLPDLASQRFYEAIKGYSNLEFDLAEGKRGERTDTVSKLLSLITGCEAAIVVNNNASAVMLAVKALADGKEVVVSRGELIEIGGSFRLPDVIEASGARLKEVGTTNRTRLSDYKQAIGEQTGMLLKCHRSNYQIVGFTEETEAAELSALGKEMSVPVVFDLGGGSFVDLRQFDLKPEPTVMETLADGIGLVLFSGDKLLGGPQAGIICGKAELVARLRKCPIYRALRADKVVLALIEAALSQYLYNNGYQVLPVFQFAVRSVESLQTRAEQIVAGLQKPGLQALKVAVCAMQSTMGGGSLPGEVQDSRGLCLTQSGKSKKESKSAEAIASFLRGYSVPIISTIAKEAVYLDLRAVFQQEDQIIEAALKALDEHLQEPPH
ncbi:MAG: L-seryl-tRNA(Sec) selenium transferase [Candidatus Obscuribacter sp.]|nr:L-seryl-tRNA(Sec) selenium transferase [Candidatus Obscuribacter sp.]MBK9278787.1 L-seryl-tRNA(Sec) selenium transferase [Candidatus Obscuribacter sp.]